MKRWRSWSVCVLAGFLVMQAGNEAISQSSESQKLVEAWRQATSLGARTVGLDTRVPPEDLRRLPLVSEPFNPWLAGPVHLSSHLRPPSSSSLSVSLPRRFALSRTIAGQLSEISGFQYRTYLDKPTSNEQKRPDITIRIYKIQSKTSMSYDREVCYLTYANRFSNCEPLIRQSQWMYRLFVEDARAVINIIDEYRNANFVSFSVNEHNTHGYFIVSDDSKIISVTCYVRYDEDEKLMALRLSECFLRSLGFPSHVLGADDTFLAPGQAFDIIPTEPASLARLDRNLVAVAAKARESNRYSINDVELFAKEVLSKK